MSGFIAKLGHHVIPDEIKLLLYTLTGSELQSAINDSSAPIILAFSAYGSLYARVIIGIVIPIQDHDVIMTVEFFLYMPVLVCNKMVQ